MKRFLYRFFIAATWCLGLIYLLSCATPFISPLHFWPTGLLSIGFPYLLLSLFITIVVWFFCKKKISLLLVCLLVLGYNNIASLYALNLQTAEPTKPTLRVLGWNVRNFDNPSNYADSPNSIRRKMFRYIKEQNADILCLQEIAEYQIPNFQSNVLELIKLGYKYSYRPAEIVRHEPTGTFNLGNAIFSKLPLMDSGNVLLNDPSYPEKAIYADVNFNGRRVRFISAHYRSINLLAEKPGSVMPLHYDTSFLFHASKFEKLRVFQQEHVYQSAIVKSLINASPYPVVFSADMNSVPASFPYYETRNNLQDCFLQKGFGFGGSMDSLPKTLRIDYLFADKALKVLNYQQHQVNLSDHYPHYTDLQWKD